MCDLSILLFGASGAGKTAQLGELAEHVWLSSNKEQHLRLYTADHGSSGKLSPIQPHINLGIIDVVDVRNVNPWCLEWACEGKLPPAPGAASSRWIEIKEKNDRVGAWGYEGFTSFGNAMMQDLANRAAAGEKIGQDPPIKMQGNSAATKTTGADGITVGSNSMAHYGVVQSRLQAMAYKSFALPGIVAWTALDRRGSDTESMAAVVGPDLVGKALAAVVPQWFNWTFHIVEIPGEGTKESEHQLYLRHHKDMTTPGAVALANSRVPLGVKLDAMIKPASLKKVFALLEDAEKQATKDLAARLGVAYESQ